MTKDHVKHICRFRLKINPTNCRYFNNRSFRTSRGKKHNRKHFNSFITMRRIVSNLFINDTCTSYYLFKMLSRN